MNAGILRRAVALVLYLAALLGSAACTRDPVAPLEEPLAGICARLDNAIARFDPRFVSPDDQWEAVARVVPGGFGGMTLTSPGGNTIYLVDPTRFAEARRVAARAEACPNRARLWALGPVAAAVAVLPGRWDYIQLRTWYDLLLGNLTRGFTLADIDEDKNRLTFGFRDEASQAQFRDVVVRLGVPLDAVAIVIFRIVPLRAGV